MAVQELKVLLIEDNPGDAFLMKFYLGESTSPVFHLSHAETVKAAIDMLAQNKFDLILSDMNLPDSFGVDTIKSILAKFPGNLVVVLTGLTDEEVGLETVRYGAQDFLVKGKFDGKVLISSVMFAFERFKLNKQIDNVSKQLDNENSRFDSILRLQKAQYIETDNNTFYSSNTIFNSLESFLKATDSADTLRKLITETLEKDGNGEFRFKTKDSGKECRMFYEKSESKFCAVIQSIS